jgi:hypothetical protein
MPRKNDDISAGFIITRSSSAWLFFCMCLAVYAISYLVRYFYLGYFVLNNLNFNEINPDWNMILPSGLNQSFLICSVIFLAFFSFGYPAITSKSYLRTSYDKPNTISQGLLLLLIVFCLGMRIAFGTRLGEQVSPMPFGLTAPVNRAINDLIPGLVLLFMEAAYFSNEKKIYRFWIFILFAFNITISALSTSKAGMVFFAAEVVMFIYLTGQPLFKNPIRWVAIFFLVLVVFALGTELRARAGGGYSEYSVLLSHGAYVEVLLKVAGTFFNRIIGLEGYALSCGYSCSTLPYFSSISFSSFNGESGRIFTQEVVGVMRDFDYRSPGLLGGAALLAGTIGGGIMALSFLLMFLYVFSLFDKGRYCVAFKIALVFGIFRFIVEGTWSAVDLVALSVGAIIIEIISRRMPLSRKQSE